MLDTCLDKLPFEFLCSKGIQRLIDYDNRKKTEYLDTLEIYLRNEMNISKTAEELFIHRSSLLKRLDRIAGLTGDDLSNSDTRLYYRILFRLLRRSGKLENQLIGA
ncbi:MAG: helix-turn-helix domain-containing protein [Synergistaceae bacterium]|jgi:DNA-binding PucR family transcriptional regulator|nr:helix-turn-helix domain-containing protein [Synergistaceae bacterium]